MRHRCKTTLLRVASPLLVAALAFAAVPAVASAKVTTLQAPAGTPLAVGSALTGTSSTEAVGGASVLEFGTSDGDIECAKNVLSGAVTSNEVTTPTASITSGVFTGPEPNNLCKSAGLGPAEVTASGLPWESKFKTDGEVIFVSNGTSKKVGFTFRLESLGVPVICEYVAPRLEGTFNADGTQVLEQFSDQGLTETSGGCPSSIGLDGRFAMTSEANVVVAETSK